MGEDEIGGKSDPTCIENIQHSDTVILERFR